MLELEGLKSTTVDQFIRMFPNSIPDEEIDKIRSKGGYHVVLPKVLITPQRAESMLQDMVTTVQRKIDEEHSRELAVAMDRNEYNPTIQPMHIFVHDGLVYFAGGRHRACAQVATGRSYSTTLFVNTFDTFDELSEAYLLTHANKALSRSGMNEIMLTELPQLSTKASRDKLMSALRALMLYDLDPTGPYHPDEADDKSVQAALAKHYLDQVLLVNDIIWNGRTERTFKAKFTAIPYAASIALMVHQPRLITVLLEDTRTMTNLRQNSPEYHLFQWMTTRPSRSGEGGRSEELKDFGYIWHHHFNGETMKRIAPNHASTDYTMLAGVPGTRRKRGTKAINLSASATRAIGGMAKSINKIHNETRKIVFGS